MGIRAAHLKNYVVIPTLRKLAGYNKRLCTDESIELMMGIAAQESDLWENLVQLGGGPGKGGNSVETETHKDVWRYLNRPDKWALKEIVLGLAGRDSIKIDEDGNHYVHDRELIGNMPYNTAIARIKLWMIPESIPDDLNGWARYYKQYYNTASGAATEQGFIDKYNRMVVWR